MFGIEETTTLTNGSFKDVGEGPKSRRSSLTVEAVARVPNEVVGAT